MKKKLFIFTLVLAVALVITGCGKEKENEEENLEIEGKVVGGWTTVLTNKQVGLDENEIKLFNDAKKNYVGMDLEPVALLGTQVVAGTNYMFLAKGTPVVPNPESSYQVVVIYKDLQGNTSITRVTDFDVSRFTNKNIENTSEQLDGGWTVNSPGKLNVLDNEEVEASWEKATETLTGMSYNPIAIVGKQVVSGTNYAILCYAKGSYEGASESIYLVALYKDLEGNQKITYSAYINLANFN